MPPELAREHGPWRQRKGDIPVPAYKRMTPYAIRDDTLYRNCRGCRCTTGHTATIATVTVLHYPNGDEKPFTVPAAGWATAIRETINRRGNVDEDHFAGGDARTIQGYREIATSPPCTGLVARVP